MLLVLKGLALGLLLTMMIGPIMIAIVQTSMENGWRSGARVAFGIWLSDTLFILACYFGTRQIVQITEWNGFELTVGVLGGLVLAGFGIGLLLKKTTEDDIEYQVEAIQLSRFTAGLKGFLVNTVNPFTFLFWITVSLTIVGKEASNGREAFLFYGSLMFVVICGDCLKVFLAHRIRPWLTFKHMHWVRTISGVAFILFGIIMVIRVV